MKQTILTLVSILFLVSGCSMVAKEFDSGPRCITHGVTIKWDGQRLHPSVGCVDSGGEPGMDPHKAHVLEQP